VIDRADSDKQQSPGGKAAPDRREQQGDQYRLPGPRIVSGRSSSRIVS
jgi:hypothetical protein